MSELVINSTEVHIWELQAKERDNGETEFFESLLSEDEIDRAGKLRYEQDRRRFISARGHLRVLLGKYLKKKPRQVWIRYGRHGKPYLNDSANSANISFNLSHSRDSVVFAFGKNREVGIDIEYIRPIPRADRIIERFFSEDERALYNQAPDQEKVDIFFKLWCGREAYSKAIGSGINLPGRSIDIPFAYGNGRTNPADLQSGIEALSVYEIKVAPGFAGSIAVSGKEPGITQRYFDDLG